MASSRKKVLLRPLTGKVQAGHLPLQEFVRSAHMGPGKVPVDTVEVLDLEGRVVAVPLAPLKWIAWVRDWNLNDADDPEHLSRRTFLARPRSEGLWVRIGFAAGDVLEGLAPLDITLLDGMIRDHGLFLMPPDIRANTQRVFVPRSAMQTLEVLGVVTTPSKKSPAPKARPQTGDLFPEP